MPFGPHLPPRPRSLRSASPNPPALWLRRAKPAFANAIKGTLRGFAMPFGPSLLSRNRPWLS
jgi:hypothetical protein